MKRIEELIARYTKGYDWPADATLTIYHDWQTDAVCMAVKSGKRTVRGWIDRRHLEDNVYQFYMTPLHDRMLRALKDESMKDIVDVEFFMSKIEEELNGATS